MLKHLLEQQLAEPRLFAGRAQAEAGVRAWIQPMIANRLSGLSADIIHAQGEIDSPASHAEVRGRLARCMPRTASPQAAR
jgi:hypothetical protein